MKINKKNNDFEKPDVDEEYLMNIISGDTQDQIAESKKQEDFKETKPKEKVRNSLSKKMDYEDIFLVNRFAAGRNGKVVYIRPEYHERLIRIVQLTREERITLYAYIDNILEYHFREFGNDITNYFNEHFKPII